MKKRMYSVILALLCLTVSPFWAGAENLGIFQGHIVDGALEEEDSKIIQGHILDGVIAEDGDGADPNAAPQDVQTFTVTFLPNAVGATVPVENKQVTNGRAYGELPVPVRSHYEFQGWYTVSGYRVTANSVVNLTANQNLYAQWSVLKYEVTLDPNGGTAETASVEIPEGGVYGDLPRPVRSGYTFEGWYTQPRGGERVSKDSRAESRTLYAHWAVLPTLADMEDYSAMLVFQDVSTSSSYYPAVCWAVNRGITSGTSSETFSPNDPCKRRHILTFLWRANGCPEIEHALSSVSPGTLWAYENALIPIDILYHDEEASTRSDVVTYLWKLAGSPAEEASVRSVIGRFSDVSPESEYASAVAWALDSGITNGTTETTFSPERICTRGQIVTFLYRCYTR
ncbi:MAG: InlB B-repeat-containing protein [Oscillibacter sp.]|nr:InlB B-repeat-containing protein [Oscillibacter sp.]